jgi:hypothetical protein
LKDTIFYIGKGRGFCLLQNVHTNSVPHQASYSMLIGVLSLRINRPEREVNLSASSRAEVEKCMRDTFTFPVGSRRVDSKNSLFNILPVPDNINI